MLILVGVIQKFTHKKHRRLRDAALLGVACALCFDRLAVMHAQPDEAAVSASAWAHDGVPASAAAIRAPRHARFMRQDTESATDDDAGSSPAVASLGTPGDRLAIDLVADFPYAQR